jgi:lysophospholipase L1-like esterase
MAKPLRPQFVLFGDSITQQSFNAGGWGAALASLYARQADVILQGYGGYNTSGALSLLDKVFPKSSSPPDVVTVCFGANDAALPVPATEKIHVPVPQYRANLHQIVSHIKVKATPTHPSCPTSINCSNSIFNSFFHKELVLGRRVGAELLASLKSICALIPNGFSRI